MSNRPKSQVVNQVEFERSRFGDEENVKSQVECCSQMLPNIIIITFSVVG